jgi:hypothetical protein
MKNSDLIGIKFNKLTVIKYIGKVINNSFVWECKCDCGKIIQVPIVRLTSGHTQSCGCWRSERNSKVGTEHAWAEILQKNPLRKQRGNCYYLVKCKICGELSERKSSRLANKKYKSCGCVNKREPGFASANDIFYGYSINSKKRNLPFEITFQEFFVLTQQECYYCGENPKSISRTSTNGEFIYNGIDRVDNSKGYIKENLKTCCGICNRMKMDMTLKDFTQKVIQISERLK